jgi:hypothetical protein
MKTAKIEKHFIRFFSPGTFMAETSELPIEKWDTNLAMKIARTVKERYGAVPYGFVFFTKARSDKDLDSKEVKTSNMYFLGGKVETLEEVEKRNDPKEEILRSNMRCNKYDKIIINTNSWKWTQPLGKKDVVLDFKV